MAKILKSETKMITKSRLGIILSKLEGFHSQKDSKCIKSTPNVHIEQYQTDPEIASEWLWNAYMLGDIEEKTIIDQGAGTGILGIGAYILGAKEVLFIESESTELEKAKKNIEIAESIESREKIEERSKKNDLGYGITDNGLLTWDMNQDLMIKKELIRRKVRTIYRKSHS